MKRVKNKYIRLTESQFNNIVQEEVKKQINYLLEYTEPRRNFIEKVKEQFYPILQYWCLSRYCTLTNIDDNDKENHWRSKLAMHMNEVVSTYLEKDCTVETRHEAITKAFENANAYYGVDYNYNKVMCRFSIEGFDRKSKNVIQAVADFCDDLNNIVNILARADYAEIFDYAINI